MALGFDGSIKIDTSVSSEGVNKGTKSITASLGGVMRAIKSIGTALTLVFAGTTLSRLIRTSLDQFDLMTSSIGGKIRQMDDTFKILNGTFVNLIVTAIQPFIPYVITLVQWLTNLLSITSQLVAAFFGFSQTVGSISEKVTSSSKEATKAAKGSLAAFDQINVLQKPQGATATTGTVTPPPIPVPTELLDKIKAIKDAILKFLQPVFDAFERLKVVLEPLGQTIWAGLQWAWENILKPLGEWAVNTLVPAFIDLLGSALSLLNPILVALQPLWQAFFDGFLKPLAVWAGGEIIIFLEWLTKKLNELALWITENPLKFQRFATVLGIVAAAILAVVLVINIITGVAALWAIVTGAVTTAIAFLGGALAILLSPIGLVVIAIIAVIAAIVLLVTHWDWVKQKATDTWNWIKSVWAAAGDWFRTVVAQPIKIAFDNALNGIRDSFITIFNGILSFVGNIINGIIDHIHSIQNLIGSVSNFSISGGSVSSGAAPAGYFSNLIPHLATGAVIPANARFAAILGDQRSGVNVEAPADLIRQIVREEMQSASSGNMTITMPVYLDSRMIYEGQKTLKKQMGTPIT